MNDNGKKKVTIKDIAEACGVSTATVSYVLNGREDQRISPETWKRVMHEVHLMGYESSACQPDLYWSHRITGDARGSQAALICLR